MFNFRKEIAEFDICGEQQRACADAAQMILAVQKLELNLWTVNSRCESVEQYLPGSCIASNQITKLAEYVATNFYHIFVTRRSLKYQLSILSSLLSAHLQSFEYGLCRVALHVFAIDDDLQSNTYYQDRPSLIDLNDPIPNFFRYVITSNAYQFQYHVHIPRVVVCIFFGQNGNF
jgi:hypothetical protein